MCLKTAYVKHNVLTSNDRREITEVWEKLGNKNLMTYKIIIVAAEKDDPWSQVFSTFFH